MPLTVEALVGMGRESLEATALEHGVRFMKNWKDETIAKKVLEKMAQLPEVKEEPKRKLEVSDVSGNATKEELADFFNSLKAHGVFIDVDGPVVNVKHKGREACINVNAPISVIKRTVERFLVIAAG